MRSYFVLKLIRVLRHLAHGKQWDRELSEEMEAHREMKRDELEKENYNAAEVESAVRRELGNVTQIKEEARAVWMWPWLEGLAQDLRMEVRQLSHARGFTLTWRFWLWASA